MNLSSLVRTCLSSWWKYRKLSPNHCISVCLSPLCAQASPLSPWCLLPLAFHSDFRSWSWSSRRFSLYPCASLSLSPSQCLFPFSYLCEWCAPALPLVYLCSQSFSRPPWWRGEEVLWLSSVWQRLKVAPSAPRSTFFKHVFNLLTILSSWLSIL